MTKRTSTYSLLAGAVLLSLSLISFAEEKVTHISIPMIENAQVFANFTDDIPAVLNYFTSASEAQVIAFYQQHFGEALSQNRKRGRLTLSYLQEDKAIRVVISQQNNKRQVDVIIELVNNN